MMAPVRSTICRRACMADGKKSDVSAFDGIVPSAAKMSKPPALAGRKTPSMSRNTILLRSSGGNPRLAFCARKTSLRLASFSRSSVSIPTSGMSPYKLSGPYFPEGKCFAASLFSRSACCFLAASTPARTRASRLAASSFKRCSSLAASSAARRAFSRSLSRASRSSLSRSSSSSCSFRFLSSSSSSFDFSAFFSFLAFLSS
mmetsp:Transcript_88317/g.152917  ORF Transcript_88317/g.152917 Transcript_88317/m.152917 type:complete len:202 (+) Transcript_88317:522-1127(+)